MGSQGWPFLVGRGRRSGHRVLLAPDFLVAQHDHGILAAAGPEVTEVTSSAGRRLTIRCATQQVDAVDSGERPRDEHGRPLRLIYGVVATGVTPVNADLPVALAAALATYRRFLRHEEEFEVEPSTAFELAAVPSRPVQVLTPAPRRRRLAPTVLCAGSAFALLLAVLLGRSDHELVPGSPLPRPGVTIPAKTTTPTVTPKIGRQNGDNIPSTAANKPRRRDH